MKTAVDPYLTVPDLIVLQNLQDDLKRPSSKALDTESDTESLTKSGENVASTGPRLEHDGHTIARLKSINDANSPHFQPTVFVSWDDKDIPQLIKECIVRPYTHMATRIVRHPTDVVFLTHLLLYFSVNVPSAAWLYQHFTYLHGVVHLAFTFWCIGSFTLMMHNHIHNNGVLAPSWSWLDRTFPYVLCPLMGHTWNSYYYHHIKHHHVEGNGPDDLSSTIRYQRDSIWHFLHYFARFFFLIWLELPLYFWRTRKTKLAVQALFWESASYCFITFMVFRVNTRASMFVFVLPFFLLRLGLMVGNWGQHALVDEIEPDSDFRSSITLIDVPSNRFCFNDGYHTAHHLNPRRHWREHPVHFVESKEAYREGRALVFHDIDYLMMTIKLLQKDYAYLAHRLVPMGDQIQMSETEIADLLRTKTRKFSEAEILQKFRTYRDAKLKRDDGHKASAQAIASGSKVLRNKIQQRPQKHSVNVYMGEES